MKTNYHTHCYLDDGSESPEAYVRRAIEDGFSVLGFSCHAPLPFKNDWTMSPDSLEKYLEEIPRLKEAYGNEIEIYTGLEVDYLPDLMGPNTPRIRDARRDYTIASVHMLKDKNSGGWLAIDGPVEELERLLDTCYSGSMKSLVRDYFALQTRMILEEDFEILGHCDLIKKHNRNNRFFDQDEDWYREAALAMLEAAAKRGVIMEVNTGGMARGYTDEFYPSPWLLGRARELGIPITLNSDCHSPENLSFAFSGSWPIIKEQGYREVRVLKNRRWLDIPL